LFERFERSGVVLAAGRLAEGRRADAARRRPGSAVAAAASAAGRGPAFGPPLSARVNLRA
jgi:hypothetical protein